MPALPKEAQAGKGSPPAASSAAGSCAWPRFGAATRRASGLMSYFPFGLSLPFIRREFKEGQTVPAWGLHVPWQGSGSCHLPVPRMAPIVPICPNETGVPSLCQGPHGETLCLTLSFLFCLFAVPQFPASAFNPPGTCLIFSCDHQREKQRMQNTPRRDILMRGGSTARHECFLKEPRS